LLAAAVAAGRLLRGMLVLVAAVAVIAQQIL
jgi:hypothetical protein